ncbi:MAG: TetR/AcrR family transcriptional regulator [Gammaproteobacteria bacterium]|nr:TetR/AcrR family transcriptional regulator [Gammaproteobacteria bacterium]MYF30353.1 TetR/AcrR family transcriptional regulator [Gammaproteobacteria bacterium]MYK46729.1 TetR/AcrR family transcriptional regulator [Gammaproteobacteria bacterium]
MNSTVATRSERRSRTRTLIIKAALRQFAACGFAGASAKTIAAEAGVAHGTVFWHFDSKSRLYEEVIRHVGQHVAAAMREQTPRTTSLAGVLKAWLDFLHEDPDVPGLLTGLGGDAKDPALNGHPERLLNETLVDSWHATLTSLESAGWMPPLDKHALAQSIVATSYGALVIGRGTTLGDVFGPLTHIDSSNGFAPAEDAARD